MRPWRSFLALGLTLALLGPAALIAQKSDKKQDDTQKRQVAAIVKLADDVEGGAAAPNDLGALWVREDYMKAANNKEYVPFTITLDPSKLGTPNVALYWRAVKPGSLPAAAPAAAGKKDDKKDAKRDLPYEDVTFGAVSAQAGTPARLSRSVTISPGTYDLIIVAQEVPAAPAQKNAAPATPKTSVLKQSITVPDYWNNELNTSSVMLAQRIDPLPAPLSRDQQVERPYAMPGMELIPVTSTRFSKKSELSTFMLIYNTKPDAMNKPNVLVEYNFCQIAPGNQPKEGEGCKPGEKFFNKTAPQNLNAETLPPQFDLSMGHQLQTGQAIPLASFPEGDYRLEIKVTDNLAKKTMAKDVLFTVTAS